MLALIPIFPEIKDHSEHENRTFFHSASRVTVGNRKHTVPLVGDLLLMLLPQLGIEATRLRRVDETDRLIDRSIQTTSIHDPDDPERSRLAPDYRNPSSCQTAPLGLIIAHEHIRMHS